MKKPTILMILLSLFTSINTNAQTMDIPEDLSGEVWSTSTQDFVLQFFENGVYQIKEKYIFYSEQTSITSIGYGIGVAINNGTYKVDRNRNTIFFN